MSSSPRDRATKHDLIQVITARLRWAAGARPPGCQCWTQEPLVHS